AVLGQRRRQEPLAPEPGEYGIALLRRPLRQAPASKCFCGETFRVVRRKAPSEAIADELRGVQIDGAREEPIPALSRGEAGQPLVPQSTRDRLARVGVKEGVDPGVEVVAGAADQIALQSRCQQVV